MLPCTMTTSKRIGEALNLYSSEMKRYMLQTFKAHYGEGREWLEAYLGSFRSDEKRSNIVRDLQNAKSPEDVFDLTHVKDLMLANRELFLSDFGRAFSRSVTYADEINEVRHAWAHQNDISPDDETRAIDSMSRVLVKIGAEDSAKTIKNLRDEVLPQQPISGNIPSWWQLATPHEDIRTGKFDENTFAAKLDDVVAGEATSEYGLADEFYRKTFLTHELHELLKDTLMRLAGQGGEAVVQLRTPFGGGKTHALIALYHLIKSAADIEALPEIKALLDDAGLAHIPDARTAVLVGTSLSAQGRREGSVQLHTLWGELAFQLGGEKAYAIVKASDHAKTSPGKDALRRLLEHCGKSLILMDEILVYQVKAAGIVVGETSLQAQTFAFLQELTEVVGAVPGAALITTFPESNIEYYDSANAPEVFDRLEKIFGRVQSVRIPVQGEEIFEVVRRRLFSEIDMQQALYVITEYRRLYEDSKDDLPSEVRSSDYFGKLQRSYPFHPELMTVLYERWGTIQGFQKTRGVLRLLARIIEHGYLSGAARPLISLGDVGLEEPNLRSTVTSILKDANWDAVIASDIAGKAARMDKELGGDYARFRLCHSTTSAIFMYSHSGGAERGALEPRLRLALLQPKGISSALISDALSRVKDSLYYLYSNGGWTFKAQPNLNAVLSDRMGQVKQEKVFERLKQAVTSKAGSGLFKPFVWPQDHKDVPDNTQLKLVLLPPTHPVENEEDVRRLRDIIQMNAAGSPRLNKNTLVYLGGRQSDFSQASEVARHLLALEDVSADGGLVLSADQKADLKERLTRAAAGLPERAKACYTTLFEPWSNNTFRQHDLSAQVKTDATVAAAVEAVLRLQDRLLSGLDPALLAQYEPYQLWPDDEATVDLKNLREYFERYPHLPMLESGEVLKQSIVRGVRHGLFELALKQGEGFPQVWRRSNPPQDSDIYFQSHYLLTRLGYVPEPETQKDKGDATPIVIDGGEGGGNPAPIIVDPANKKKTRVVLTFDGIDYSQIHNLVDVAAALEDAGGKVRIRVTVDATNAQGLDETVLELNVQEVISQHGLNAEWDES